MWTAKHLAKTLLPIIDLCPSLPSAVVAKTMGCPGLAAQFVSPTCLAKHTDTYIIALHDNSSVVHADGDIFL